MATDFEQQAEAFHQELYREYYLAKSGLKEQLSITPVYDRYSQLFTEDAVNELLPQAEDRRGRYLAEWVTLEYLENLVKSMTESISNAMRQATVDWEGQKVAYHNLRPKISNEADMGRRHRLDELERQVTASANPEREQRLRLLHDKTKDLSFDGYSALCDQLRGLNLSSLTKQMQDLLDETRGVFYQRLGAFLDTIDVPSKQAGTCDILYLFRAPNFDVLFSKEAAIPALTTTLAGIGIDLDRQGNLELDVEPRPLKSPRAFCAPIRVPQEVKLVIKPQGGQEDYASLLHEAGHAEHFANVDPVLPFPYKRLGDNSVTEAYAFLFHYLLLNPRWLERVLGADDFSQYLELARFQKLWLLRRYSSKLIYEQQLDSQLEGADEKYVRHLEDALGVAIGPENYLADVDDAFYCAQYLRAWIFEVQLRRFLEDQYGGEWFTRTEAGDHLISLWRQGQQFSPEELVTDMGYDGLDSRHLVEELLGT
ncbi:MAG: hypothetical protein GTO63_05445 [Anaerolineae bacterium]|nr:hypothetical protein [Anaerolineae bacterium]NIN94417.1 hypothetical protein [Anaerolineae bacterium]NIQ77483.1 hypothetical protein [Anaerolineae bacterium]